MIVMQVERYEMCSVYLQKYTFQKIVCSIYVQKMVLKMFIERVRNSMEQRNTMMSAFFLVLYTFYLVGTRHTHTIFFGISSTKFHLNCVVCFFIIRRKKDNRAHINKMTSSQMLRHEDINELNFLHLLALFPINQEMVFTSSSYYETL